MKTVPNLSSRCNLNEGLIEASLVGCRAVMEKLS
jgi:hypothetical protein